MADETASVLERLYGNQSAIRGGFGTEPARQPIPPYRPPEQEPARMPHGRFVDQIENGTAHMLDDQGHTFDVPATHQMHEGRMEDGSAAPAPAHHLNYAPWPDDGVWKLGEELPKVPLAPGSPGPPIPPPADSMIGQKKGQSGQKKRRVVP